MFSPLFPALLAATALSSASAAAAAAPQMMVQPLPGTTDADRLAAAMRRLAVNAQDLSALIDAGELSLRIDDLSGAASLFARAEKIDPHNGRVKAGMGSILVRAERPGEALRYFDTAERDGLPPSAFAADRGLAYDLVGEQERAQRDYRLALKSHPDDETVRRYALSLAISGDQQLALDQLDPLLRKTDRGAWRTRAFVLAMGGKTDEASRIATTMLPAGTASGLQPFFRLLPTLSPADRAFAVHFGEVRATPERLADAQLVPPLPILGPDPDAPRVQVAAVQPASAPDPRRRQRKNRHDRSEPNSVQVASAAASTPAPPPVPAPAIRPAAPVIVAQVQPVSPPPGVSAPSGPIPSGNWVVQPVAPAAASGVPVTRVAATGAQLLPPASRAQPPGAPALGSAGAAVAPGAAATAGSIAQPTATVRSALVTRVPAQPSIEAAPPPRVAFVPPPTPAASTAPIRLAATTTAASSPTDAAGNGASAPPQSAPVAFPSPPPASARVAAVAPVLPQSTSTVAQSAPAGGAAVGSVEPAPVPAPAGANDRPGAPIETTSLPPSDVAVSAAPGPSAVAAAPTAPDTRIGEDAVITRIVAGLSIPASELGVRALHHAPAQAAVPDQVVEAAKASAARDTAQRRAAADKVRAGATAVDDAPGKGEDTATAKAADRKVAAKGPAARKPHGRGGDAAQDAADDTPSGRKSEQPDGRKTGSKKMSAAQKKEAAAKAAADKAEAEAKKAERANPERIWVQVAGGASADDLPKAWAATKAKAPELFAGRSGWTTPLRATNRVLAGPFKTDAEARAFVNKLAKKGLSGFAFTSDPGQVVAKLPAK